LPGNPKTKNDSFFKSKNYFQNPWSEDSVKNPDTGKPILIIGSGLTMVDTVIGLIENNFPNSIYSISPNGFNILPHLHPGLKYIRLLEEIPASASLYDVVKLFNKHMKLVRKFGISAEPVIDSLRPVTQKLWQSFSEKEKKFFMKNLRHLWGVARHRIPLHIHERLQNLRTGRKLEIISGRIINITEGSQGIIADYFDKKQGVVNQICVGRVINCTGPETDLLKTENNFLKNLLLKGEIAQDGLKLGINADPVTFRVLNSIGEKQENLYTIGSNLKGVLWESTAVNELRTQGEKLSEFIVNNIKN
jgi:uncharacterized NAD(P)/FAD-binding protein YdhS